MNKRQSATVLCAVLSLGLMGAANATCTKPVGTYAGAWSGAYYDGTGALLQYFASDVTLTFSLTGSGTVVEYGKQLTGGAVANFANSTTFTSFAFIPTTCRGALTTSSGQTFTFSVVENAKEIQLIDYSKSEVILVGHAVLKKI